jgi:outer membrane lipoprotein carrier protein
MRFPHLLTFATLFAGVPALAQPRHDGKGATSPPADPAREAVTRIQKFYEATNTLHARFEQELTSGLGVQRKAAGDVWLKKPGRMRWEYQKPEKKLMVADGTSLWVYEPEDEQAFKQSLKTSNLPSSVAFLFGTGKLSDEFTVTVEQPKPEEKVGAPGDLVLKLVPLKPTAQYKYLVFVVDPKSYMVKETYVYDQQGGVNHMIFSNVETNLPVADGKFVFAPPEGTKIIRP